MMQYISRPAEASVISAVFDLIMARVRWIDETDIRQ